MTEACKAIVGLTPKFKPEECGEPGIRVGDVVKCANHWTISREYAEKKRRKAAGRRE